MTRETSANRRSTPFVRSMTKVVLHLPCLLGIIPLQFLCHQIGHGSCRRLATRRAQRQPRPPPHHIRQFDRVFRVAGISNIALMHRRRFCQNPALELWPMIRQRNILSTTGRKSLSKSPSNLLHPLLGDSTKCRIFPSCHMQQVLALTYQLLLA